MRILQLSDFHLRVDGKLSFGVVDTVDNLNVCMDHIKTLNNSYDLIVVTGDLADNDVWIKNR